MTDKNWRDRLQQDLDAAPEQFARLIETIGLLRHPQQGCPWDLKQDHESLRHYMLEEAYEAVEAMGSNDYGHLREELGDVLLQVVLNSQILRDGGEEGITSVITELVDKMIRRHPHVFKADSHGIESAEDVKRAWNEIKKTEKGTSGVVGDVFAEVKKQPFPSLLMAYKIGKKAESIKFDWSCVEDVWQQFLSEVKELEDEIQIHSNRERIFQELGDVFFSLAQLCRHLGFDPEVAASSGNQKFLRRFGTMEQIADQKGVLVDGLSQSELEELWQEAKKSEQGC